MLIHSKNRYYLIFYISKIDQLQFIRMFQKMKKFFVYLHRIHKYYFKFYIFVEFEIVVNA